MKGSQEPSADYFGYLIYKELGIDIAEMIILKSTE